MEMIILSHICYSFHYSVERYCICFTGHYSYVFRRDELSVEHDVRILSAKHYELEEFGLLRHSDRPLDFVERSHHRRFSVSVFRAIIITFSVLAFRAIIVASQFRRSEPSSHFQFDVESHIFSLGVQSHHHRIFSFGVKSHHHRIFSLAFRATISFKFIVQSHYLFTVSGVQGAVILTFRRSEPSFLCSLTFRATISSRFGRSNLYSGIQSHRPHSGVQSHRSHSSIQSHCSHSDEADPFSAMRKLHGQVAKSRARPWWWVRMTHWRNGVHGSSCFPCLLVPYPWCVSVPSFLPEEVRLSLVTIRYFIVFTLLARGIVEHRTAMWELEEIGL
uniref:Uncharacterized protein n=1 Tax=Vitis vinifera TaxID=29760 RepID=A5BQ26_VITVI|nr:hypothetical protein VITISV_016105 [Vitis vinifera]